MARKRRPFQRCTAICADGQRCGRWCKAGQLTCSAHDPSRKAHGVIAAQAEEDADPETLYRRLMRDREPQIRLRALNAYLDWLQKNERRCKACAARTAEDQLRDEFVVALTDAETAALYSALAEVRRIKQLVYERLPHLRPESAPSHPRPLDAQEASDEQEAASVP